MMVAHEILETAQVLGLLKDSDFGPGLVNKQLATCLFCIASAVKASSTDTASVRKPNDREKIDKSSQSAAALFSF